MGAVLPHFTCWLLINFIALSRASSRSQTSSFVVSANYGVQSEKPSNQKLAQSTQPVSSSAAQGRKTDSPSAWKGCDHQHFGPGSRESHVQKNPSIYVNTLGGQSPVLQTPRGLSQFGSSKLNATDDIVYGSSNIMQSDKRFDNIFPAYEVNENFNDPNKPSVDDLQQLISKLVKGATKVHQVVKVPAVYEIHFQEQEEPKSVPKTHPGWLSSSSQIDQFKQSGWKTPGHHQASWSEKRQIPWNSRGSRHVTKTWNLPSKIKFFDNNPSETYYYGKYAHPKPFSGYRNAKLPQYTSSLKSGHHPYVSVPITPGSTSVRFPNYNAPPSHQGQAGVPDLSLYYSKKNEIEQQQSSLSRRNNDKQRQKGPEWKENNWRRDSKTGSSIFDGLKYIIHVREKMQV